MSFYSSLLFVRESRPPVVAVSALSPFLEEAIRLVGTSDENDLLSCSLKYGDRIDSDDSGTEVREYVNDGVFKMQEIEWDDEESFPTCASLIERLQSKQRTLYRAYFSLGSLKDGIIGTLSRDACEENDRWLSLTDLSFRIEPMTTYGLGSTYEASVGWMGFAFSGYGYYYPWTYRDARLKAEQLESVQRLMRWCRETWPVATQAIPSEMKELRSNLREQNLWLYDQLDLPPDWRWYVAESG
ncbi:MAG TPA: hypothetical protein PLN21_12900 [Gemmatales bacterium]|nr:hypothetical protein [Gemmatales bacterium]